MSFETRRSVDDIFSLVYEELRRMATAIRVDEPNITLSSTALVHEAWLKLKDSRFLEEASQPHFKAIAAKAMRQVLVDEARRRHARKRGSREIVTFALNDASEQPPSEQPAWDDAELLVLDSALDELTEMNPRQAQVIESRFFGGLTVSQTAALLGVSESSVERDWRTAKAWLAARIRRGELKSE